MKKYATKKDLQDLPTDELELQVKKGEAYLGVLKNSIGEKCHHYSETYKFLKMLKRIVAFRYH